jgi:hypothetical protein
MAKLVGDEVGHEGAALLLLRCLERLVERLLLHDPVLDEASGQTG